MVPDVNCLHRLTGCLLPCITKQASECVQEELSGCDPPTIPPTTTTTTTPQPVNISKILIKPSFLDRTISQLNLCHVYICTF